MGIKRIFKKIIYRDKRFIRLLNAYRRGSFNAVVVEIIIMFFAKFNLSPDFKYFKYQSLFLYKKSKHLSILEKLVVPHKKSTIKHAHLGKRLKILPLEEI